MFRPEGKPTRRWIATVGVMVALIGGVWFNQDRGLKAVATETHGALCALKRDLETRHNSGVQYLKDHPNGLTAHGEVVITAAQIQQSLDAQSSTLKSLSGLDCS